MRLFVHVSSINHYGLILKMSIAITGYMCSETETSVVFLDVLVTRFGQDCDGKQSSDRQSGVNAEFLRHFFLSSGETNLHHPDSNQEAVTWNFS